MPKLLSVIDYGLLYLDKEKIALGTKIAEYIVMGVPIIINENIQSAADLVREHNCGEIVNIGLGDLDAAPKCMPIKYFDKPIDRRSIRKLGGQLFSLDLVANEYFKIYKSFEVE